jgi:protein-S-isoprenylcysteine O-methyltransferase Ste14
VVICLTKETLKVFTVILQVLGWLFFTLATVALGIWLRKHPGKTNAEWTSRILHFLFWVGVIPPTGLGVFYPGLWRFDEVLGLSPLPRLSILPVVGISMLLIGVFLFLVSNIVIRFSGKGAHAFLLTKQVATVSVYRWTRNPMSMGFYFWSVGGGLLIGSTYWTFGALLLVIPMHIFYLKFFEEYELELRLGQPYLEYKRMVPFLFPRWVSHES